MNRQFAHYFLAGAHNLSYGIQATQNGHAASRELLRYGPQEN
jgi:hypothetical protein